MCCSAFTKVFEVVLDTPDDVRFVTRKAKNLGVKIEFMYDTDPDSTYYLPIGMKVEADHLYQIINFLFDWIVGGDWGYDFGRVLTVVKPMNMSDKQFKNYFNYTCKWFASSNRFRYFINGIKDGGPMKKWLSMFS